MTELPTTRILDELVDLLEANAGEIIRNPDGWRRSTRTRLANLDDDELRRRHAKLSGEATSRRTSASTSADYKVREIDHAISLGLHLLGRREADTGMRTVDDQTIAQILTDEHGPAIAGRALALIDQGAYRYSEIRNVPTRDPDLPTSKPMTFAEYQAATTPQTQEGAA